MLCTTQILYYITYSVYIYIYFIISTSLKMKTKQKHYRGVQGLILEQTHGGIEAISIVPKVLELIQQAAKL